MTTAPALLTTQATFRALQMSPALVRPTKVRLKTETRRTRGLTLVNNCPDAWEFQYFAGIDALGRLLLKFRNTEEEDEPTLVLPCPYGRPGDVLWVRENWTYLPDGRGGQQVAYQADFTDEEIQDMKPTVRWRPSIHLERKLSRMDLTVVTIGIERLHEMTEEGAMREGMTPVLVDEGTETERYSYLEAFKQTWARLNGAGSYEQNPWVFVLSYDLLNLKR